VYHLRLEIECFKGKLMYIFNIVWDKAIVLFHLGFKV
jgi:hypothetical protein